MRFRTNKDNKEYITIKKVDLTLIAVICEKRNIELCNEAMRIFGKLIEFGFENSLYNENIEIRKDSVLGTFLLKNPFKEEIINADLELNYDKVVSAFNIAVFKNNEIAKKILPLFQKPEEAKLKSKELVEKYGEEVIDFILENNDFDDYLIKLKKDVEPTVYTVYEDGEFSRKTLVEKPKQKTLQ